MPTTRARSISIEAIRRLVETALAKAEAARTGRVKSAQLAGQTIDVITDPAAAPEERAKRKRRLLKGPRNFAISEVTRRSHRRAKLAKHRMLTTILLSANYGRIVALPSSSASPFSLFLGFPKTELR